MNPIYLDHNATTPMLPEVADAMRPWLGERFGNPSSQHQFGRRARQALEEARDGIGQILGARQGSRRGDRVIFTSGGTEANNLALLGAPERSRGTRRPSAVLSRIEHPSVMSTARWLERQGWALGWLEVDERGVADVSNLESIVEHDTQWVSLMAASNETGVLQPVAEAARACDALGVPFHVDAVQMVGKLPVNFAELGATTMSVAAHKFHGPVGIGALLVQGDYKLRPMLYGGFQQQGLRPGTEPVALAVGMHAALQAWQREAAARAERMQAMRDRFEARLSREFAGTIQIHGAEAERLPQTAHVAFIGLDRQELLVALDLAGVACSTGSACASGSSEPSTVLLAMGCSKEVLQSSLRFSFGATTTAEEVDVAADRILKVANKLAGPASVRR